MSRRYSPSVADKKPMEADHVSDAGVNLLCLARSQRFHNGMLRSKSDTCMLRISRLSPGISSFFRRATTLNATLALAFFPNRVQQLGLEERSPGDLSLVGFGVICPHLQRGIDHFTGKSATSCVIMTGELTWPLARLEPLYALIPVFTQAAFSEVTLLNLMSRLIEELMAPLSMDEIRSDCFESLQQYGIVLQRHAECLRSSVRSIRVLRDRHGDGGPQWRAPSPQPQAQPEPYRADPSSISATGILEDYEDLLEL